MEVSLDHILCKNCRQSSPVRQSYPSSFHNNEDPQETESQPLTVACPRCNHVAIYQEHELQSLPSSAGLSPGQQDAELHLFEWVLECGQEGCKVPRHVFQVLNKATSSEALQSQSELWIWEGMICRGGERHTFTPLPAIGKNRSPGPPKFDRRFSEKLKQAGFDKCDPRRLSALVHYAWNTLVLTHPVECAFFRLVTVEDYTIDETVEQAHSLVGKDHVSEKMVRRHIQLVEDLFVTVLEFYREAEIICPGSASRVYGCFHSLLPDEEAIPPFHLRFLEVILHVWAGFLDPISKITNRLRWGQPDASKLPWLYKKEAVPAHGSLIPAVLEILMAATPSIEAARICRLMIALAHDKKRAKSWRKILEAAQPDGPAKPAHEKVKMVLLAEKLDEACMAILGVLARSYLNWKTLCGDRFRDLADIHESERVERCYYRFLLGKRRKP